MKSYLLIATLHSKKQVCRVITGHKLLLQEMQRILSLSQFYANYEVYTLSPPSAEGYQFFIGDFRGTEYDIHAPGCFSLHVRNGQIPIVLNH